VTEDKRSLAERLGISADKQTKVLPTKFATPLEDAFNQPKQETHRYNNAPLDKDTGDKRNDPNDHILEKTYFFPDSFNALRVELHDNWPNLWQAVQYVMAYDGPVFVELMDAALDTRTTFDTATVGGICAKYIDLLRAKRGLSPLHTTSEKA
jgi:hypothetical protein